MFGRVTVVGEETWTSAAVIALAAAGHVVADVADVRDAFTDGPDCIVCSDEDVAAFAALRERPAIVAIVADESCETALAALDSGADECVDRDAPAVALQRAVALAMARRVAAARARRDALTGTADRAVLHEHLATAMSSIADGPGALAVLFIDLDAFKAVNDEHGHHMGDRVLVDVARRLLAGVRPNDLVARYGGDEFVVVCEHVDPAEARAIVARLTRALEQPIGLDGHTIPIGASIGVAITRNPTLAPVRLVALADADMYRVKAARRPLAKVA